MRRVRDLCLCHAGGGQLEGAADVGPGESGDDDGDDQNPDRDCRPLEIEEHLRKIDRGHPIHDESTADVIT